MAVLPDDVLMVYADGLLDGEAAARVEALLHQDAESRRLVEIYRATGAPIAKLYEKTLREPVPSHLVHFVRFYGGERPAAAKPKRSLKTLMSWGEKLWPRAEALSWRLAAASAAALVIGVGAGWVLRGELSESTSGQQLADLEHGQVFAMGPLQQILEKVPSGREVRISGSAQESTVMRASLTFKNKEGGYCREYELLMATSGQFVGLACRQTGGKWALQVHVAEGLRSAQSKPSTGPRADPLEPVVDRMIEGDALGKNEEGAVIANGWR